MFGDDYLFVKAEQGQKSQGGEYLLYILYMVMLA